MIVVEGFDGSGKSTLAARIAEHLKWTVLHTGGPTIDTRDVDRCLYRSLTRMKGQNVQDRITHISESVYSMLDRPEQAALALGKIHELKDARVVVYCRPPTAFLLKEVMSHKPKEHESWTHVQGLKKNAPALISIYDCVIAIVSRHTRVIRYDRTDEYASSNYVIEYVKDQIP